MKKVYFLGIDAGTSRIKAALIDYEGNQIDLMSMPVEVLSPFEGACEIDMINLWHTMCKLTNSLKERNPEIWSQVVGIGITGQGDGLWPINRNGQPVRYAMLWNDTRTKNLKIKDRKSIDDICIKNFANPVYAGSAHILLRWLKEKENDSYRQTYTVLHCKDWLNFKLTGEIVTDYSDASTALMDVFGKKYITEILEALDLAGCEKLFPEPVSSTTVIGKVTKDASIESGIQEGIPVIAGAIDVAAVALGAGVKETGDTCTIVGTTLCNEIVLDQQHVDFSKGMVICHTVPEKYMNVMPTLSGTSTLDWVIKTLVPNLTFKEVEERLADIPIGSKGIIYHPYIYGERAPFRNPFACGGFFGLTAIHTKFDMVRAAYEGLVFSLYDCYQYLPQIYEIVHVSGGGSESEILCQMFSDCLGKKVIRPAEKQLGISGVVTALKISLGYIKNISQIKAKDKTLFIPNMVHHHKYILLFDIFKNLRINMEEFWSKRYSTI